MTTSPDSAAALISLISRKAPEYLDLLTATSDAAWEVAFCAVVDKALRVVESNRKEYTSLSEVGLSGVFAAALSIPGLTVTQETNSNGHVDLTITADHCNPARTKLGEAKVYRGPDYHIEGVNQLLGRYTTGRELGGLLLEYVRKPGIATLMQGIRDAMDAKKPCKQQGRSRDHTLKWSFATTHRLKTHDAHELTHLGCNVCSE